jgi:hypothetical protein
VREEGVVVVQQVVRQPGGAVPLDRRPDRQRRRDDRLRRERGAERLQTRRLPKAPYC